MAASSFDSGRLVDRQYRPLTKAMPDLYVLADPVADRDRVMLLREECKYADWNLDELGRKPGHGLLVLRTAKIKEGERVADLCAGPLALFSQFAVQMGAGYAEAVELDADLAACAAEACGSDSRVHVVAGDLDDISRTLPFDQVFVHPPMLPDVTSNDSIVVSGDVGRDVASQLNKYHMGGVKGRETLDRAIAVANKVLRPEGTLVIAQFEFLGVESRFSDEAPSTFDVLSMEGFMPREVHHYCVPLTGTLLEHLATIRSIYSRYPFVDFGDWQHRFSVVHATKSA